MPNVSINLTKWYHFVLAIIPVVSMFATSFMWMDTRYMHKEMSDTRFIELQIRIVEGHIRDYTRVRDNGDVLSAVDEIKLNMDTAQLQNLMVERNRMLGIGGLPQ